MKKQKMMSVYSHISKVFAPEIKKACKIIKIIFRYLNVTCSLLERAHFINEMD